MEKPKGHIDKKSFVELLDFIIKLEEKEQTLNDALQEFCDNKDLTGFHSKTSLFLVEWLGSLFEGYDNTIAWWLWDCPKKGKGLDLDCSIFLEEDIHSRYVIKTPEDLYDYLMGQLEPVRNNPMKVNGFYCRKCKKIIKSTSIHDFRKCDCGNYVDGGLECPRQGGNFKDMLDLNDEKTYTELNKELYRLQEEENDE